MAFHDWHLNRTISTALLATLGMLAGCIDTSEPAPEDDQLQDSASSKLTATTNATGDSWTTYVSVLTPTGSSGKKTISIEVPTAVNGSLAHIWEHIPGSEYEPWTMRDVGSFEGSRVYTLTNKSSGKCLDMAIDGPVGNGTRVQQWSCGGGANQQWVATKVSNTNASWVKLRNRQAPNLCLDLPNFNFSNGARLQVWSCSGDWNQRWNIY